jgi:2-polyprenyl-3-methyl-5-hydroxy-6-metoxy-1,4-benzoquinol methylase
MGAAVHAEVQDIEYFTSEDRYIIRQCAACDILFIDPMLTDSLEFIYPANYYSFVSSKKNWVVRIKEALDRRAFRRLTAGLKGDRLSVIDVGGGTGWLANQLRDADGRFQSSLIVDLNPDAADAAMAQGHEFFLGRFEDLPVTERRFDLILMMNIIEHVPDPRAVLEKAAALLAPGGVIWMKTPNFDSMDARIFRHQSWGGYHAPRHFILFNRTSMERTARRAGLSVSSFSYTQGSPFWTISILELLRRIGLVKIDKRHPSIYHPLAPLLQAMMAAFDFARLPFGGKTSQMVLTLSSGTTPADRRSAD